jgi:hypothetical protein
MFVFCKHHIRHAVEFDFKYDVMWVMMHYLEQTVLQTTILNAKMVLANQE